MRAECIRLRFQCRGAICQCVRPLFCHCAVGSWQVLSWCNSVHWKQSSTLQFRVRVAPPNPILFLYVLSSLQILRLTDQKKSVEQLQNAEGGKYLLPGFPPTHPACGTVHSSDRNRMDQIPSGTNSCFTTRPVSVTRGKVIPCHCPLVAGWRRWPVSRLRQWQVSMCGCMSSTPSPSASWAGEKPGPWAPKLEDLSLPGTTCSLHTGAGLSKQLLHFTRNYRPGAAENEGPTVRAAVILPGSASMSLLIPGCTAARGTERTMPLSSVPLRASPILEVS